MIYDNGFIKDYTLKELMGLADLKNDIVVYPRYGGVIPAGMPRIFVTVKTLHEYFRKDAYFRKYPKGQAEWDAFESNVYVISFPETIRRSSRCQDSRERAASFVDAS